VWRDSDGLLDYGSGLRAGLVGVCALSAIRVGFGGVLVNRDDYSS
jgi:hypothetical protein